MQSIPIRLAAFKHPISRRQVVWVVALLFFFLTSWWSWQHPLKFDSPDETAAYVFARQFADGRGLSLEQPFHQITSLVSPRGASVVGNGQIVPATFLGLILVYGFIGTMVSGSVMLWLTPLFSSLALVAFFAVLRKIFSDKVAFVSTLLLAIHPAFWYYSSRGMYHNVLFLDLLIFGCWSLSMVLKSPDSHRPSDRLGWRSVWWYAAAGLLFGLAMAVRPAEAAWVSVALLGLTVLLRQKVDFRVGFWVGVVTLLAPLVGLLVLNNQVYGEPSSFGYEETISASTSTSSLAALWDRARFLFFPFGIHVSTAWQNIWQYGVSLIWWVSVPALLGALVVWRSSPTPTKRWYLVFSLAISAWLALSYGSWVFFDNPDPTKVTLGTSYMRYWLPAFTFGLPYAATTLGILGSWLQRWRPWPSSAGSPGTGLGRWVISMIVAVFVFSFTLTVLNREEGLATTRQHAVEYRNVANRVVQATPPGAVIVAGRADKIFFPERPVIVAVDGADRVLSIRQLLEVTSVYVYVSPVEAPRTVRQIWEGRGFTIGNEMVLSEQSRLLQLHLSTAT